MTPDPVTIGKAIVTATNETIKATADTPGGAAAREQLGKTALTVSTAINNVLLPLAAVNFGIAKARRYFETKFPDELAERTVKIPLDQLVEPKASIAGPALQALAFAHEEPDLKSMYLGLIASAMNTQSSRLAHPAFVEVVKQLEAQEAQLLQPFLTQPDAAPLAELRVQTNGMQGFVTAMKHLLNLRRVTTGEAVELDLITAMVDNWGRLGLTAATYDLHLGGDHRYDWAQSRPEHLRHRALHSDDGETVVIAPGLLAPTEFGRQFAAAVGMYDSKPTGDIVIVRAEAIDLDSPSDDAQ